MSKPTTNTTPDLLAQLHTLRSLAGTVKTQSEAMKLWNIAWRIAAIAEEATICIEHYNAVKPDGASLFCPTPSGETRPSKTPDCAATLLTDWPKTPSGRLICAPSHPMPSNAAGRWAHTNAGEVGDQESGWPGGDIIRMRCRDCGATWREELPQ
jgi:hypothetical protein